jgi:hypothetical protein
MITTILEVLVAVVVLIVFIALAALHFLRADDSDTFDDMPEEPRKTRRHPAESRPPEEPGPAERRARRPERASERRPADGRGTRQPGYGNPGAGSQRPVPVGARQASSARAAGPDPATGWESLSDVDYWAEVASDKPLTPAEPQGAPAKRGRRGIEPKADAPRPADLTAGRADPAQLPARQRSQSRPGPAAYGAEAATQNLAALARLGDQPPSGQRALPSRNGSPSRPARAPGSPQPAIPPNGQRAGAGQGNGQRPAGGPRPGGTGRGLGPRALPPAPPQSPAAPSSHSGGHARPPLPMDDDPLTSPSFPAINTSDSRSYRTRSRSGPPSSQPPSNGGRGSRGSRDGGSYGEPGRQMPDYPGQASAPNGYPVQPAAPAAGHVPAQPAAPAANPYGSYVSPAQPSYPEPASAPLDAASYGTGYAAGQQAAAAANWYGGSPETGQAIDGYLPAPGSNGAGNGYSQADYGAGYQNPAYPGGQPALPPGGYGQPGHPGPYDQRGYHRPDAAYGQDGYEAYPGYGGAAR